MIAENTAARWRLLANERPLVMALVAGLVATHIATITGYWFHGIGLETLQFPQFNAYLLFRPELGSEFGVFEISPTVRLVTGWIVHTFTGVVWALVYAVVVLPILKWKNNMSKALLWGVILATISALWWVPVLFPEFDLGFFSRNFDVDNGFLGVVAIYLWHAIYAVNLGLIYNPMSKAELAAQNLG